MCESLMLSDLLLMILVGVLLLGVSAFLGFQCGQNARQRR